MASLRFSQIRATVGSTIHYIANKDKIISPRVHDIIAVLNYMGEEDSTERIYSFARHCSCNPDLAAKQMDLYRARYYANSNRPPKDGELLGLHFFLSFSEDDDPSEDVMTEIAMKICEHSLFNDHGAFGACHFDKHCKHVHFFVSNFSATGSHKKLCMRHGDYNQIRKYANKLCYEYGLSIIDLPALRYNDPEYSNWIDDVIASGQIIVHPEREEHKGSKRQKATTREIYYKWLQSTTEFNLEEERRLTAAQLKAKKAAEQYYWSFEEKPKKPTYPITNDPRNRYYVVRRYTETGRKRSLIELICILIMVIYQNEIEKRNAPNPPPCTTIKAKVDPNIQALIDSVRLSREMSIDTPEDVAVRLTDTGKQMNGVKREKARLEACIKSQATIISAWELYQNIRSFVENISDPDPEMLTDYKATYTILAHHQILTAEEFQKFQIRHEFQIRKIADYEKKLAKLRRQYRGLKKLQSIVSQPDMVVKNIYDYRKKLDTPKQPASLDEQIKSAETKKSPQKETAQHFNLFER